MPSPSPGKFRGPIVRQLSLQSPLQSPASKCLKKQLSVDDSKVLNVEVTGQGWNVGSASTEIRNNVKMNQSKITGSRPKPVKVAWADRKLESQDSSAGVEVIATKCQGQPRPTSLKTQRLRSPLLGNKDTLVYTRLQLAERLRNAWSEREKIKPNINIFLAGAPDTTRSENEPERPASAATFQDTASAISDTSAPDKKRKAMRVRAFSQDYPQTDTFSFKPEEYIVSELSSRKESEEDINRSPRTDENDFRPLQELNKIEIRMLKIERDGEGRENKPPEEELDLKRSRNKPELESRSDSKDSVSAQDRRASFRRSSMLNKTITESFSSPFEKPEVKIVTKPAIKKAPLVRAFSAPSQNEPGDGPKVANLQKKVKIAPQRRLQPSVSFDIPGNENEDMATLRERIKSAPVRRRLKSAAARRKNKERDSSDDEKDSKISGTSSKKNTKKNQLKKGGEIVTMVSLVSPAESDTEDSVINLPIESWRDEKEEQAATSKSSSRNAEDFNSTAVIVQKFVSLRKTTKSVTFQPHPVLSRSYSASFPSRRAPAGTPVIVPTPIISNPALTPAQLLERDKRNQVFTSSGFDGRGIKRKLFRSASEAAKEDEPSDSPDETPKPLLGVSGKLDFTKEPENEDEEKSNDVPEFKCPKEKECWTLYQKMIKKGVSVSFDTVLRGMLTPTEYRLRKNHLLSNC